MSYVRIYVHLVFCTKNRYPFLRDEFRLDVFRHMKLNAEKKKIWLDTVNGYVDYTHCLLALGKNQSISEVVQLLKGESSYWINAQKLLKERFSWQDDYWVRAVEDDNLNSVRQYIFNQEIHHKKLSFVEEVNKLFDGAKAHYF